MSDSSDSDPLPHNRAKTKKKYNVDTSPASNGSGSSIDTARRKKTIKYICGDSESDSSQEIIMPRKKRLVRLQDDSDLSDSSGSSIIITNRKPGTSKYVIESDETDESDVGFEGSSEWENDGFSTDAGEKNQTKSPSNSGASKQNVDMSTDSSNDETSEKCPICLLRFKTQEIGSPESCDHNFCVDCIQEWSKNVNTCPVDRQQFSLILVRKSINSKIIRQIPVETPAKHQDVEMVDLTFDDTSFCEICGSGDREDRMLLCDGCDLAFHLECLTPPLENVPQGIWYCRDCDNVVNYYQQSSIDAPHPTSQRRNIRLVPRTRQSERVRARIADLRSNQNEENNDDRLLRESHSDATNMDAAHEPGTSRNRSVSNNQPRTTQRKKRKSKKRKYKTVYEVDPTTGETVAIKKVVRRKRKSRKQRERERRQSQPQTVKKRLAKQLGICSQQSAVQHVPDVKSQGNSISNRLHNRRQQAGIPTLHLFGTRDELDYFSESDTEYGESDLLLRRRRPNMSDISLMRRSLQRKRVLIPAPISTCSTDLLGSILESQTKFHSRNSVFSLNKDGTINVELNNRAQTIINDSKNCFNNNNNNRVDLHNYRNSNMRQAPMYPNSTASDSTTPNESNDNGYQTNSSNSPDHSNFVPTSTVSATSSSNVFGSGSGGDNEKNSDYCSDAVCSSYDSNKKEKTSKSEEEKMMLTLSRGNTPCSTNTPNSDSELDIYSDIETVSTSRADDTDLKPPSPVGAPNVETDEEHNNDSDADLIIDTEKNESDKYDPAAPSNSDENTKEEAVSSTVDSTSSPVNKSVSAAAHSTTEIQSETVQSSSQIDNVKDTDKFADKNNSDDDVDSEDGCPNFSIYSTESINLAKTTEMNLQAEKDEQQINSNEISSTPPEREPSPIPSEDQLVDTEISDEQNVDVINAGVPEQFMSVPEIIPVKSKAKQNGLYSDSEDESIVKIDHRKPFGINDLRNMTEDISEEERSYTPCLDEKDPSCKQGIEGLDTEMISDEDRNDFDESHEQKTASDGDALEINAKESELDFTRPEDYEEGEIVDKVKAKKLEEVKESEENKSTEEPKKISKNKKSKEAEIDKVANKENETQNKEPTFKKLSKSNKERNYRDKDRSRSKEKRDKSDKENKENKKEKRKEKRKEIERYDVRSIIADKPRRVKDQFGRDEVRRRSSTPSSRSASPYRSVSRGRRSHSKEKIRKRRDRSRDRRSFSRSRSRSFERRRSLSRSKKRRRSASKERPKRRKSRDRSKVKSKKNRSLSRHRSRSLSPPKRRRNWERRRSREWTPSLSRSRSPVQSRHATPSWTPPRLLDNQPVKPHNLTVILTNDSNKKRKEKKKKSDKKTKETIEKQKKRRRDRTPLPSKEVFASGDNILVSVSFNKDSDERDVTTAKRKREAINDLPSQKKRKEKRTMKNRKKNKEVSMIKPVAIIDLERSPFRVITPSPKDIIVLSDSENGDNNISTLQKGVCDSSAQAASPERSVNNSYSMGPKTPPEPQVKFSLNAKPPQLRPISNPLHEPDDVEPDIDPQEELEQRLNEVLHKGPNTPPEPPNSPPSSPDAYDPFDPTKSRSPTPEPIQVANQSNSASIDDNRDDSMMESRSGLGEILDKATATPLNQTPDVTKSHTPPIADVQPADSQSSSHPLSPDNRKSPERIAVVINQVVQSQASTFPIVVTKSGAQTTPYSSVAPTLITSTPISSSLPAPRINILSSTLLTSPHVASSLPQRIVLPNTAKSSPVKVSPTKPPIKSNPIKPMLNKNTMNKSKRKSNSRNNQSGNDANDVTLDFESPYSPGSSDYEDLFEPPTETYSKPTNAGAKSSQPAKNTKSPAKLQNAFDALFGSSPVYNTKSKSSKGDKKFNKKNSVTPNKGTKQVGVKLDEDSLKILDELPNSAVEMQVKDKFLKKLNRQERVVEEVKLVLKPHYNKKRINKEEYKDILRRAVPKICHNKSGEINPKKIQNLIEAYVKKVRHSKKVTSSSSINPQKA